MLLRDTTRSLRSYGAGHMEGGLYTGNRQTANLFSRELAVAYESLKRGSSTVVQAERGGGKTAFCVAVKQSFQDRGEPVWSAEGSTYSRTIPFGVATRILVQAGDQEVASQRFSGAAAADAIIRCRLARLVESSKRQWTHVVIDNFHLVDEPSVDIIVWMLEKLPVSALLALPPVSEWSPNICSADPHRVARSCIRLPKLGYEGTVQHVTALLPEGVDSELFGAVHALAAGNVGLVTQIVKSSIASERMVVREERWVLAGDTLWNPYLEEIARARLHQLPRDVRQALLEVALCGPIPYDRYVRIADDDVLAQLEERGLVLADHADFSQANIDVAHPIIAEYARRHVGKPEGRVLLQVSSRGLAMSPKQAPVGHRFIEDSTSHLARIWDEWKKNPSRPIGLQWLERAWGTTRDGQQIADVFAGLRELPEADERTETRLEVMASYWEAVNGQVGVGKPDRFDSLLAKYPGSRCYLSAGKLVRDALWCQLDPGYRQVLSAPDAVSMAAKAFLHLVDLRPREAIEVLTELSGREVQSEIFASLIPVTWALAINLLGDGNNALKRASDAVFSARKQLDHACYSMAALAYATIAMGWGRATEAMEILDGVLELSQVPFGHPGVFLALTQIDGKLAGEVGKVQQAELLLQTVDGAPGVAGSLPFMDGRYADVFRQALAGGTHGHACAADIAEAIGQDALARGYTYAALEAMHVALMSNPTEPLADTYESILHSRGIHVRDQFCKLVHLVAEHNWLGLQDLVDDWSESNTVHDAAVLLLNVADAAGIPGKATGTDRALLDKVSILKEKFPTATKCLAWNESNGNEVLSVLSPRELEIVNLAGSHSNRRIAVELGLSIRTVENHLYNALRKTGFQNKQELFLRATCRTR